MVECLQKKGCYAGIRYIFDRTDIELFNNLKWNRTELLVDYEINDITDEEVTDSASRFGYYIICSSQIDEIKIYFSSN